MTTYHRTIDGKQVSSSEALDANGMLRDGHTLRSTVMLMDGAPGPITDEQRNALIDSYNKRVSEAWRNPSSQFSDVEARRVRDAELATIDDPYAKYDQRLANAWR